MRRARRAVAVMTLAGLVMPGVMALAAAAYLSDHHRAGHHHAGPGRDVDLSVVWHGHAHATATPDHDHAFFVGFASVLQGPNRKVTPLRRHATTLGPHTVNVAIALTARRPRDHPPGLAGVGPPSPERLSILRI